MHFLSHSRKILPVTWMYYLNLLVEVVNTNIFSIYTGIENLPDLKERVSWQTSFDYFLSGSHPVQ